MAILDSAKVDLLYKKLFGAAKSDLPGNKGPANEATASPFINRGDKIYVQAAAIPAVAAAVSGIVGSYNSTSRIQCTADATTTPVGGVYPTWKTGLSDWIPPEFGSTYFVKAYVGVSGLSDPATTGGTQIFDSGSGGTGEWWFDYQAGVLNFIGGTIPATLTASNVVYIYGYRYIGAMGANSSIAPGTDISLSTTSGVVTISNISTLQSVTGRGNSTTNAIIISSTATSTSTTTGALTVVGGVGVGAGLYVGGAITATGAIVGTSGATISGSPLVVSGSYLTVGNSRLTTSRLVVGTSSPGSGSLASNSTNIGIDIGGSAMGGLTDTGTNTTTIYFNIFRESSISSAVSTATFSNLATVYINNSPQVNTASVTVLNAWGLYSVGGIRTDGTLYVSSSTASTSTTTGALQVVGGVGVGGDLFVGGTTSSFGTTSSSVVSMTFRSANTATLNIGTDISGAGNGTINLFKTSAGTINLGGGGNNAINLGGYGAGVNIGASGGQSSLRIWTFSNYPAIVGLATSGGKNVDLFNDNAGVINAFGSSTNITIAWTTGTTTVRNTLVLSNTATSTSTTTGALQVSGGVGVGGSINVASTSYINGSKILVQGDLATVVTTATFITNDPTSQVGLTTVAGTSTAYGSYQFGDVNSVSTFNDYNTGTNTGFYSINDAATQPGYVVYVGFTNVVKFTRFVINLNYTASSGHTIDIDLYNFTTSAWDTFTTYSGTTNWFQFILEVIDTTAYLSAGKVYARLYHVNTGNAVLPHNTKIDYIALQDSIQGGQGPRGATGATGAQGPQGLTTSTTSSFIIFDTTVSTGTNSGALQVIGGSGIGGNLNVGGNTILTGNLTVNSNFSVGNTVYTSYTSPVISSPTAVYLDTFSATQFRTAKYLVQITDTGYTPNRVQVAEILVFHDNNGASTIVDITNYGISSNTGELGSFDAVYLGGLIEIYITPTYTPTTMTVRLSRTAMNI